MQSSDSVDARVVTSVTRNHFVFQRDPDPVLKGICMDLWRKTATELNLTFSVQIVEPFTAMHDIFRQKKADIIVQRIEDDQLLSRNITE